jgi:hypothetical protein
MTTYRRSIFDRISEERLAREALEREQALADAAEAAARALLPEPIPITAMKPQPSRIDLGGFSFELPGGFAFRDVEMSIECDGLPVVLKIQRREVGEADQLAALFEEAIDTTCKPCTDLRIIRRYDTLFAGSEAKAIDFSFKDGAQNRHGRLVAAIVPLLGVEQRQWLSLSSVIDPSQPALATWLIDFDNMLAGAADA